MTNFIATLIPDTQDNRDYIFEWDSTVALPDAVDLRHYTGQIESQLAIGSCTANATVGACEMFLVANAGFNDTPTTDVMDRSRLFNYYNSRHNLGGIYAEQDLGSTAREALRSAHNDGLCSEQTWPYNPASWNTLPTLASYDEAKLMKIGAYYRIVSWVPGTLADNNGIGQIKYALAQGYPVLIGMQVGEKLRTLRPTDVYPYVHPTNNPLIGGHEMVIVGYDADNFIIKNSWGSNWCDGGYWKCRQSVVLVDQIDIWVVKGFAGYTSVGPNLIMSHNEYLVKSAYRTMLHREPEPAGLLAWINILNNGLSNADFRRSIAQSQEFISGHSTVESLYLDILIRTPNQEEINAWNATGLSITQMIKGFIYSAEFSIKFI